MYFVDFFLTNYWLIDLYFAVKHEPSWRLFYRLGSMLVGMFLEKVPMFVVKNFAPLITLTPLFRMSRKSWPFNNCITWTIYNNRAAAALPQVIFYYMTVLKLGVILPLVSTTTRGMALDARRRRTTAWWCITSVHAWALT